MKRMNIQITEEFDRELTVLQRRRKLKSKSEAIRVAVKEAVERTEPKGATDFAALLGLGLKAPLNPNPRFQSDDDLWS